MRSISFVGMLHFSPMGPLHIPSSPVLTKPQLLEHAVVQRNIGLMAVNSIFSVGPADAQ